jgi:DNA repair protein RadD
LERFDSGATTALLQAATGAGKTIMFSLLIRDFIQRFPKAKIAVLAHRRELVAQAKDKLLKVYPEVEVGVACSSLEKKKDLSRAVTIGTIQTLARQASLNRFDLVIIDEVHRLPPKNKTSQMGDFLDQCWDINPNMKFLGVTATPYRMNHGYIYGNRCQDPSANWFEKRVDKISVETLQKEGFLSSYNYLLAEGDMKADLNSCSLDAFGEYDMGDLEKAVTKQEHLNSAVQALSDHALDRRSIVIFCVSISHAKKLQQAFIDEGIVCESIHSEMPVRDRDEILNAFNRGEIRILTNVGVLTEGWDAPRTDCVMLCRPTQSAALYVQMVGRGLRTFPGKRECMVLDLVGCFEKHGSIRAPIVDADSGRSEKSSLEHKDRHCPDCREIIPLRISNCPYCDRALAPVVITVDESQTLVSVEDDVCVVECDACQVPYRYEQLQIEWFSEDFDRSPLGMWYCPEEHPVKVMEPTKPVEKSGEYELFHVDASMDDHGNIELRALFFDALRDPYEARIVLPYGDDSLLVSWLKACGVDGRLIKKLEYGDFLSALELFPRGVIEPRPHLTMVVASDGCFVEFC